MSSASSALIPLAPLHRFSSVNGARRSFLCHRNPWRSRISMSVSVGSRAIVGTDALFQDFKPSCAFFFPGQVIRFRPSFCELVALFGFFREVLIVILRKATVEIFVNDGVKMRDVGAQTVGMGVESQNVNAAAALYKKANDILGMFVFMIFTSFEDGLKLVKLRGEAMQESGFEKQNLYWDKKIITLYHQVRLAVAGAFHTNFMEPAVSRLEAALATTEIRTPRIPVISNVDAQPHSDPDTIKKILALQVSMVAVIAGILKRMDKSADLENIGA
ncbi:hypothetical protein B296_00042590 [Ensete ventricosum]|uniref:Uncharacterized protein n=1 Tax=Ensete ventricosum TaxID=4639 RepID=A0A426Y4U0_ENSVE|nr:hypothetical protein B296_00042590 [Ensete ventricosum]